jgi:hypothetical protein
LTTAQAVPFQCSSTGTLMVASSSPTAQALLVVATATLSRPVSL